MGEVFWGEPYNTQTVPKNTIYAQTFSPLWTHEVEKIRLYLKYTPYPAIVKVSIQYLKPDGTPTGADLTGATFSWEHIPYGAYTSTRQRRVAPIQLVKGINYAFCVETIDCWITNPPSIRYKPPPGGYLRGKMIKSDDGGSTWDTTSLGDMHFGEYGDPPLVAVPYDPPLDHWAVSDVSQINYLSYACTRVATTIPCTLQCLASDTPPKLIKTYREQRGTRVECFDYYSFENWREYDQEEDGDSLYHTFLIKKLKEGEKYWYTFIGTADFNPTFSSGVILSNVHPGGAPFTTIRRPNAPGDWCQLPSQRGDPCPHHWKNVDEATPDEDETCVWNKRFVSWYADLYNIPNLLPEAIFSPIGNLVITARIRRQGGMAYAAHARIAVKTHDLVFYSPECGGWGETWGNMGWELELNPHTMLPWTYDEINALQIGISLKKYRGVGWGTYMLCTQMYCKIYHKCEAYN